MAKAVKIDAVECINLNVPFTGHTDPHMRFWLPHWHIVQLCRLTLDNGVTGWGETIPNYTWAKVPGDIADKVVGRLAGELLWEDGLGAGVQMALFDAIGKTLGVPAYRLLGTKVKDWCPLSWWAMDMPAAAWAQQCRDAVELGYTTAKLKARTWYDLHAGIRAIIAAVPPQFRLDLDFNATLANAANAVEFLKTLEQYDQVAMIESPIPQGDVAGNRQIRARINRPLAMHYGSPPFATVLEQDVADGFVVSGGAHRVLQQAHAAEVANKPFWLQLVGTGMTTTWAAHLGAVATQAKWPAITCMNIWDSQVITQPIVLRGGFYRVPEAPGLGVEPDPGVIDRYRVDYEWVDPPRHVYRYVRADGEVTYFRGAKEELHSVYPQNAMPISEAGSSCEPLEDDGSPEFDAIYQAVQHGGTVRRLEA